MLKDVDEEDREGIKAVIDTLRSKLPQREKDWVNICDRWKDVDSKHLSDHALERWNFSHTESIRPAPIEFKTE